jgi:glutathione synthase/RimK-type ligase-like ATP-grasp enzyme
VIIVISRVFDPHTDYLAEELNHRGIEFVRFHTEDYPVHDRIATEISRSGSVRSTLHTNGRSVDLSQVTSIWYRRPAALQVDPLLTAPQGEFALRESRHALAGTLSTLDCLWINHPDRLISAAHKIVQLQAAATVGLETPATLVTNDPQAVPEFFRACRGQMIYKTLALPYHEEASKASIIYTTMVTAAELDQYRERVRFAACQFQEWVPKQYELRMTVIGQDVFCARIDSQASSDARIDWRAAHGRLEFVPHSPPPRVATACIELTRTLGLVYSAIDIIVTPDNRYVFLEINPNGQWAWMDPQFDNAMSESLIGLLCRAEAGAKTQSRQTGRVEA